MRNSVEILRAICFTKEDLENITNLGDSFSKKEIEFMVEFKKIYELGTDQLEKFINKLDEEGKDLDTYSILYYVETLLNGPFGSIARTLSKDKKYFTPTPESMGMLGNVTLSPSNTPVYVDTSYQLGCSVDTYNKLPKFSHEILAKSIKTTEDLFRSSIYSSSYIDNTFPVIDKETPKKYDQEKTGKWEFTPNATYLNKDPYYFLSVQEVASKVFDKVKSYLGDENFRVYKDKKTYNPFSDDNESVSDNFKVEKKFVDPINPDIEEEIILDILGDEFDSEDKRSRVLKISGVEKDKEYVLNTNEGQLGN